MRLHRLIMLPNGHPHEQHWGELPHADDPIVRAITKHFEGLGCDAVIPLAQGRLRVVWSGSGQGGAIGSLYLDDSLFLCTVLACGIDPTEDQMYLTTAGNGWAGSDMVRGFAEGEESPFAMIHEITDRPLLVGLLVPTLAPDVYAEINGVELAATSVYVANLAVEQE